MTARSETQRCLGRAFAPEGPPPGSGARGAAPPPEPANFPTTTRPPRRNAYGNHMGSFMGRTAAGLRWAIAFTIYFSIADAFLTLVGIRQGVFYEVNPLLRMALQVHDAWFLALKGALMSFWVAVMIRQARHAWVPPASVVVVATSGLIIARSMWLLVGGW